MDERELRRGMTVSKDRDKFDRTARSRSVTWTGRVQYLFWLLQVLATLAHRATHLYIDSGFLTSSTRSALILCSDKLAPLRFGVAALRCSGNDVDIRPQ